MNIDENPNNFSNDYIDNIDISVDGKKNYKYI